MTRYAFATNMQAIRLTWNKINRVLSDENFRTKYEKELAKEITKVYERLKKLDLDGYNMDDIWILNPTPNSEPWQILHRRTHWIVEQYDALAQREIKKGLEEALS